MCRLSAPPADSTRLKAPLWKQTEAPHLAGRGEKPEGYRTWGQLSLLGLEDVCVCMCASNMMEQHDEAQLRRFDDLASKLASNHPIEYHNWFA